MQEVKDFNLTAAHEYLKRKPEFISIKNETLYKNSKQDEQNFRQRREISCEQVQSTSQKRDHRIRAV